MVWRKLFWASLCAGGLLACQGKEPPHLLYNTDPQALDNPFPDARLLGPDGGYQFRANWYQPFLMAKAQTSLAQALMRTWADGGSEISGVGNFAPTLLTVSDPVDPSTLAGSATRLVQTASGWQVLEANVHVEHSTDALAGTGVAPTADYPEFLVARPSIPLPEGQSGLLVMTAGPKTTAGVSLGRGFVFNGAKGSGDVINAAAKAMGVKASAILLALPQQAAKVTPVMKALAQWVSNSPAPAFTLPAHGFVAAPEGGSGQVPVGVWKSTDADWNSMQPWLQKWSFGQPSPDVGQVVVGTFQAKDLRDASGTWAPDFVAAPDTAPGATLYFVLTLPVGAKPAGGYHVVIGGHGINARNVPETGQGNAFCLEIAEVLAQKGLGCLGIDAVSHGTRGSALNFFNVEWLPATRDNFREMAFDQMQLSHLAASLDIDGAGVPSLSPDLGYFGNSLGSIMGANFMSFDTRVKFGVLNVGGGGLTNILTSPNIRDLIGLLIASDANIPFSSEQYYGSFPLFRTVGQLFVEPGDPVNLAQGFASNGKAVLLQEGIGDLTIPNTCSDALAATMGLTVVTAPVSGQTPLQALYRLDPAKYGQPASYNGHNIFWDIPAARTQAQGFLGSGGTQIPVE